MKPKKQTADQKKLNASTLALNITDKLFSKKWIHAVLFFLNLSPLRNSELMVNLQTIPGGTLTRVLNKMIKNNLIIKKQIEVNSSVWMFYITDYGRLKLTEHYAKSIITGNEHAKMMNQKPL